MPWVGEAHLVLKGHRSIVNQVRFNPSNNIMISSGVEKVIKVGHSAVLLILERLGNLSSLLLTEGHLIE